MSEMVAAVSLVASVVAIEVKPGGGGGGGGGRGGGGSNAADAHAREDEGAGPLGGDLVEMENAELGGIVVRGPDWRSFEHYQQVCTVCPQLLFALSYCLPSTDHQQDGGAGHRGVIVGFVDERGVDVGMASGLWAGMARVKWRHPPGERDTWDYRVGDDGKHVLRFVFENPRYCLPSTVCP